MPSGVQNIAYQNKLVYKVTNSKVDYANNVRRIWGVEWAQRDIVYRFSNGRIFRDSFTQGGPYGT